MLVTIYVNYVDHNIYSEADFQETIREKTEEILDDMELFEEYLADHYSHVELFEMSNNKERAELLEEWEKKAMKIAKEELYDDWDEETLEI